MHTSTEYGRGATLFLSDVSYHGRARNGTEKRDGTDRDGGTTDCVLSWNMPDSISIR